MNGNNPCAELLNNIFPRMTMAEKLLELAHDVKYPKQEILDMTGLDIPDDHMARIKTALDLDKASAVVKLRAIFEEWDLVQIVRELY